MELTRVLVKIQKMSFPGELRDTPLDVVFLEFPVWEP